MLSSDKSKGQKKKNMINLQHVLRWTRPRSQGPGGSCWSCSLMFFTQDPSPLHIQKPSISICYILHKGVCRKKTWGRKFLFFRGADPSYQASSEALTVNLRPFLVLWTWAGNFCEVMLVLLKSCCEGMYHELDMASQQLRPENTSIYTSPWHLLAIVKLW